MTAGQSRKMVRTKPQPPIEMRWTADGRDARVTVQIVSGIDYVGATVRLTVPGEGRPMSLSLPAAPAGEVQTAEWVLDRPASRPPRIVVEIDTGEGRMSRSAVAPWAARGKASARAGPVGPTGQRLADRDGPDPDASEMLVILPAEERIRRRGD